MIQAFKAFSLALCLAVCGVSAASAADPGVTLIGRGLVPGNLLDKSGLKGKVICQLDDSSTCIDQATFGGFGSALTYTGRDGVFLAVPDRGPFDGRTDVPYLDRFHFLRLAIDLGAPFPNITTTLLDTRFLTQKNPGSKRGGRVNFVGSSGAFDAANPAKSLRLDPEGVRVGPDGTFFISDEYGPYVLEFDRDGVLRRRISVPAKFLIANPSGDVDSAGNSLELYPIYNTSGRQANRGMEGLAITPDGKKLVGIMQNALIQDHGLNSATPPGRVGVNNRILAIDLRTGATREYVYVLDAINQGKGVNEILAINDHEFLVLERDNRSLVPTPPNEAQTPNLKRIYKIDLASPGLTDVSGIPSLPATAAELGPLSIVPVSKTLFLDLLDPSYTVDATNTIKEVIAEKIEGLAWGPDLKDGRHLLYVVSDNDLSLDLPTQIYAFAIDGSAAGANIDYKAQKVHCAMFPSDQVRKALGHGNRRGAWRGDSDDDGHGRGNGHDDGHGHGNGHGDDEDCD